MKHLLKGLLAGAAAILTLGGSLAFYGKYRKDQMIQEKPQIKQVVQQPTVVQQTKRPLLQFEHKWDLITVDWDSCYLMGAYEYLKHGYNLAEAEAAAVPIIGAFFKQAVSMIPHMDKRHKGGEDAYVARNDLIVVADGVGGWGEVGIDPGLFSKALVKYVEEEYLKDPSATLKHYLIEAVKRNTFTGSSTAVLAKLEVKNNSVIMKTCNLGDSGYVIFRAPPRGAESTELLDVYFRSKEQQYRFNFPYQCGTDCELPFAADDNQHTMLENDIVVMGSDGLFDNLYHDDILACIYPQYSQSLESRHSTGNLRNPLAAAECIAKRAEELSFKKDYMSPFARGAQEVRIPYRGGKHDDVTVIVAQVTFKHQ